MAYRDLILRIVKLMGLLGLLLFLRNNASGIGVNKSIPGEKVLIEKCCHLIADIKVKILDEAGLPLPNVTVKVKGTQITLSSNAEGEAQLQGLSLDAVLLISFLGYKTREISLRGVKGTLVVTLEPVNSTLNEVDIVNTGYQRIPKERVTGSFEVLDSTALNRVTGSHFIDRLRGASPSLSFYNYPFNTKPEIGLVIRTQSSISMGGPPVIVLDNFRYDGDLDNINPNDIQDVTLLKDAAAASIWGVGASRGVILVTTKKGKFNQPIRIDFNSSLTVGAKPDLYALHQASPSDYIALEQYFFDRGKYNTDLNPDNDNGPKSVSPGVHVMYQLREGQIDSATAKSRLTALASHDLRKDFLKYVYRNSLNRQYALNINGGDSNVAYSFSGGYDSKMNSLIGSVYDRVTLKSNALFKPTDKLEIQTSLNFAVGTNNDDRFIRSLDYNLFRDYFSSRPYTYLRLADDAGNPLVYDEYAERKSWLNGLGKEITSGHLLSWDYNPLAERDATKVNNTSQDILLNVWIKYQLLPALSLETGYQYQKIDQDSKSLETLESIGTRAFLNTFSSWPNGILKRNLPLGDFLSYYNDRTVGNTFRSQLSFNQNKGDHVHQLNAVVGVERRELDYNQEGNKKFGYDQKTLSFKPVNLDTLYPVLNGKYGTGSIMNLGVMEGYAGTLFRYASLYANASYTYLNKYSLSGSYRKDASNILGSLSNQQWQPLWSAGIAWVVSREKFYHWEAMPDLKLRMTYGYNGAANLGSSGLARIFYAGADQFTGLPRASIINPPNSGLKMEKTGQLNLALDFSTANKRIVGTLEVYKKYASNLVASAPIDATTGFSFADLNTAATRGTGVELTLNTDNLGASAFKWNTTLLFSYTKTIVTKFSSPLYDLEQLLGNASQNPVPGKYATSLFALKFVGLDPETGDPMGYLNGELSKDYAKLLSVDPKDLNNLRYFGSAFPIYSGLVRNTFSYKRMSLSVTMNGKFGYFFRKPRINYMSFLFYGESSSDFGRSWKKPGDEKITNVPSPSDNILRDQFYIQSEAMVLPGDHILLQDAIFNYALPLNMKNLKNVRLYANAMNLNVFIWRKNKEGIDPNYSGFNNYSIPAPRTIAVGVAANF